MFLNNLFFSYTVKHLNPFLTLVSHHKHGKFIVKKAPGQLQYEKSTYVFDPSYEKIPSQKLSAVYR